MKLCECGCGAPAPIAKANHRQKGHVKGQPTRFVNGHNNRGRPKSSETRERMSAYASNRPKAHHEKLTAAAQHRPLKDDAPPPAIHKWLNRHHPKSGRCEHCGAEGKTDYAFTRHPEPYTRRRSDYLELCRGCHTVFDVENGTRPQWDSENHPSANAPISERSIWEQDYGVGRETTT